MPNLTYTQYVAMTMIGIISATLSLIGSFIILFLARNKWKEAQHRIVSWLSVTDILFTFFGVYAQVWFSPQNSRINLYWAHGTKSTCTVVGAISSWLRLAGSLLNCSLSIYFLLIVKYGWRNRQKIQWRMEFPTYGIIVILPSLLMVISLRSEDSMYGVVPILNYCFLKRSSSSATNQQSKCSSADDLDDCQEEVVQVEQNMNYGALTALLIIVSTIIGFICTFVVNCRVRRQMRLTRQSSMTGLSSELATEVAWQSRWYSLAYFNTFIWPILLIPILRTFRDNKSNIVDQMGNPGLYTLAFVTRFFLPLQGALNCIVYIRPYYRQWLKVLPPNTSRWVILQNILTETDLPSTRSSQSSPPLSRPRGGSGDRSPHHPAPPLGLIKEGEPLPGCGSIIQGEDNDGTIEFLRAQQ